MVWRWRFAHRHGFDLCKSTTLRRFCALKVTSTAFSRPGDCARKLLWCLSEDSMVALLPDNCLGRSALFWHSLLRQLPCPVFPKLGILLLPNEITRFDVNLVILADQRYF